MINIILKVQHFRFNQLLFYQRITNYTEKLLLKTAWYYKKWFCELNNIAVLLYTY